MSNIICAKCGAEVKWRPNKGAKLADAKHSDCGGQLKNKYAGQVKTACGVCGQNRMEMRMMEKPFTIYNREQVYPAGTKMCKYHYPKTKSFPEGYQFTDGTIRPEDTPKEKVKLEKVIPPATEGFTARIIKYLAWNKRSHKIIPVGFMHWQNGLLQGTGYLDFIEFTGRTDKNGVEVYEAFIVKYAGTVYIVEKFEDAGSWRLYNPNTKVAFWFGAVCWTDVEVIGNLFQNPELLKGVNSKNNPV